MIITQQHLLNHKALTALLKIHKPSIDIPTWINDQDKKIHGKRSIVIDVNDDWTKATVLGTDVFHDRKHITCNIYTLKGGRIHIQYNKSIAVSGNYFTSLPAALNHFYYHETYHKNSQYAQLPYNGCGSYVCTFCNLFKITGILPTTLPMIP